MPGLIYQLNSKPKTRGERGLPKYSVEEVRITFQGMEGDFNHYRSEKKGSTLSRALLLYPLESIYELNQEGWPIQPGDLGENVTMQGIPYSTLQLGKIYRLGEIRIQIAEVCKPCVNLSLLSYVGKSKVKKFMQTVLERRGWYARVLQEGMVRREDGIEELVS